MNNTIIVNDQLHQNEAVRVSPQVKAKKQELKREVNKKLGMRFAFEENASNIVKVIESLQDYIDSLEDRQESFLYYVPGLKEHIQISGLLNHLYMDLDRTSIMAGLESELPMSLTQRRENVERLFQMMNLGPEHVDQGVQVGTEVLEIYKILKNSYDDDVATLKTFWISGKRNSSEFTVLVPLDIFRLLEKPIVGIYNDQVYISIHMMLGRFGSPKYQMVDITDVDNNLELLLSRIHNYCLRTTWFKWVSDKILLLTQMISALRKKLHYRKSIKHLEEELKTFRQAISLVNKDLSDVTNDFSDLQLQSAFSLVNVSVDMEDLADVVNSSTDKLSNNVNATLTSCVDKLSTDISSKFASVVDNLLGDINKNDDGTMKDKLLNVLSSGTLNKTLSFISGLTDIIEYLKEIERNNPALPSIVIMLAIYYFVKDKGQQALWAGAGLISFIMGVHLSTTTEGKYLIDVVPVCGIGSYLIYRLIQIGKEKDENIIKRQSFEENSFLPSIVEIGNRFCNFGKKMENMSKFVRSCESLATFMEKLRIWVSEAYNSMIAPVLGFSPIENFAGFMESQVDFLKKANEFLDSHHDKSIQYTINTFKQLTELVVKGDELFATMKSAKDKPHLIRIFGDVLSRLHDVKRFMQQMRLNDCMLKIESVSIQFVGLPKRFKTFLLNTMIAICIGIAGTPDQLEQFRNNISAGVYNRMTNLNFWDNYSEADVLVTIIDDFLQAKDSANKENSEALDIIHMINSNPFMLNQAHLHNKGATFFNSPFVVTTTNVFDIPHVIQSVNEPEAVARRFHLRLLPVPKEKYCSNPKAALPEREFDMEKVPKVEGIMGTIMTDIQVGIFDFYELDIHGKVISGKMTIWDIAQKVRVMYEGKVNQLYRNNDTIASVAEQVRDFIHNNPNGKLSDIPVKLRSDELDLTKEFVNRRFLGSLERLGTKPSDESMRHFRGAIKRGDVDVRNLTRSQFYGILRIHGFINPKRMCPRCGVFGLLNAFDDDTDTCVRDHVRDYKDVELQALEPVDLSALFKTQCYFEDTDRTLMRIRQFVQSVPKTPENEAKLPKFLEILHLYYVEIWMRPFLEHLSEYTRLYKAYQLFKADVALFQEFYEDENSLAPFISLDEIETPAALTVTARSAQACYTAVEKLRSTLGDFYKQIEETPIYKKVGIILGTISGVVALIALYNKFNPQPLKKIVDSSWPELKLDEVKPQNYHTTHKIVRNNVKGKKNYNFKMGRSSGPNVASPVNNLQSLSVSTDPLFRSLSDRNLGTVRLVGTEKEAVIGQCLYLDTNHVMLPLHFLEEIWWGHAKYPEFDLVFADTMGFIEYIVPSDDIERWIDDDTWDNDEGLVNGHCVLAKILLKREKRPCIKYFLNESDLDHLPSVFNIEIDLPMEKKTFQSTATLVSIKMEGFVIPKAIEYICESTKGDCGSLVFLLGRKFSERVILGMHFGGSESFSRGYSGFISREAIQRAILSRVVQPSLQGNIELLVPKESTHFGKFNVLANVSKDKQHLAYSPRKTDFRKTPYYNYGNGESTKAPALLNVKGDLDPYANAMAKFPVSDIEIDQVAMDRAVADLKNMLFSIPFPLHRRRILTIEEALWGVPGLESWGPIASSTSSGYPMKLYPATERIKNCVLEERNSDTPQFQQLREEVERCSKDASVGIRWLWIFTDNLKNELLKLSKVLSGNTRLFCGAPFVYLLVFRMYFGAFAQFIVENRIDNESAVGMNPYSEEWDRMTRKLLGFSPHVNTGKVEAGDYAAFDISQRSTILWIILQVINEWYDDEHATARETFWLEVTNSRHIFQDVIYEWFCSLPSGHPFTIFINNLYNCLVLRYAYFKIMPEIDEPFNENVRLIVTGDDNSFSCHDSIRDRFNMPAIAACLSGLGLKLTLDDKDAEIGLARDITEITFLKRHFIYDHRLCRWIGALSLNTILEAPRWSRRGQNYLAILEVHIREFFKELSLHTKQTWDKYSKPLLEALQLRPVINTTWILDYYTNRYNTLKVNLQIAENSFGKIDKSFYVAIAPYLDVIAIDSESREVVSDALSKNAMEPKVRESSVTTKSPVPQVYFSSEGGLVPTRQEIGSYEPSYGPKVVRDTGSAEKSEIIGYTHVTLQSSGRLGNDEVTTMMGGEETFDTTHMYNDAVIVEGSATDGIAEALTSDAAGGVDISEDIRAFLARPRKFKSGLFSVTDIVSTFNADGFFVPFDVIDNVQIGNKLKGYHGIRMTTVLTLVVNANKFQQGRYMLCAIPTGGTAASTPTVLNWVAMHIATRTQRTQLPRVEIDLACDTSAVLRLPFSAAQDYYPLTAANDTTRYGTQYVIRMFPYSPLEYGTGSANAAWSLWVHFEDIELISAAVPATGLQAGGDVTKIEQKSKGAGPVESVALKVSKASKFLTPVPFIGQYATGLGWVADIVGNVAKVFGWSNPTNLEQEHRVIRAVSHYANNVDKLDPQSILALTTTNKIALRPSLKDNAEDQLDIANFAGRFAFISRIDWTIANTEGTELYSRDVTPAGAVVTTATFSDSYSVYTPAQWLAKNFRYWRGSMVYKFKIVKTEFHSGRIAVAFTPNSQLTTTTTLTYPTSDYTYREIIDIRDMNEYTFAVPFISHTPYKTTGNDYQEDNSVGTLKVYVVDPLKCPDVVAGAVRIYVEMAGGPDFEVQQLFLTATTPITDMALQAGACEAVPKSLGSSIQTKFQLTSAADCFGERIMSLRSLVKRSHIIQRNREVTFSQPYLVVFPFMYNALETATLSATLIPWQISDLYGALASMFTYSTGSVNIKAYPATQEGFDYSGNLIGFVTPMMGDPDNVGVWSHLADVPSSLLPNTRGTESHMSRFVYGKQAFKENHAAEFSVPGYHFLRRTPNADGMIYQNIYRTTDGVIFGTANFGDKKLNKKSGLVVMVDGVGNNEILPGGYIVSRAGGEDCDFSGFISIPPMLNNISNDP